uniref:EIF-4F 25 kDa subunit n=1 Tax=Panagrolaimus sp. ES5 TaxID=591445 RepID=A0AC34FYJ1_9BILA
MGSLVFKSLYSNIQPPTGLPWNSDYYLFREGIKPMWEDPSNIKGGRWLTQIERTKRAERLDNCWLELMMALVGEQFSNLGSNVCGAVVNVRQKGDKVALWTRDGTNDETNLIIGNVALWTRDGTNDETNLIIGNVMREKLGTPPDESLRYEIHKDASTRTGSVVKPRLVLPKRHPREDTPKTSTA